MDEVTRICDEVIFLDRGHIVAQDTPERLTRRIPHSRVRIRFDGQRMQALQALDGKFAHIATPSDNVIVVTTEEHLIPQTIFDIGNAGVHIVDIDIEKPTLEDVFLQIARGN